MVAMIIGAIVVIGYTVLGGFLAVSTTDLIQSIIMTFALIIIVLFGIQQAGGMGRCDGSQCQLPARLPELRPRGMTPPQVQAELLRRAEHRLHPGLGPGLLRHAPHPAALHGHPRTSTS